MVHRIGDASRCPYQVPTRRWGPEPWGGASYEGPASAPVEQYGDASPAMCLKGDPRPDNWPKGLAETHHERLTPRTRAL